MNDTFEIIDTQTHFFFAPFDFVLGCFWKLVNLDERKYVMWDVKYFPFYF